MTLPLVPAPVAITPQQGTFTLSRAVTVSGNADAVTTFAELMAIRTGLKTATVDAAAITLDVQPGTIAEAYQLSVDESSVSVVGSDAAGLFYGIHTLVQLLQRSADGWQLPRVKISDAPRFSYRGVMLDVARHFFSVDVVKAYIDRASALKFNHLHLHLTDDQGWRFEVAGHPLLTELGSGTSVGGDPGGFYTRDDYQELVAYAAKRHMTVVPEIDLPGHTHAVGLAYPHLVAEPMLSETVLEDIRLHGGETPRTGVAYDGMAVGFSSLRTEDTAARAFVADVLRAVAESTPGPYLHIGGDESLGTDPGEYAGFMAWVTELITNLGKTPIAWHEAGATDSLSPATIGQYWGLRVPDAEVIAKSQTFVRGGGKVILSPADAVYLDIKPRANHPLGLVWTGGHTSLTQAYQWEPAELIEGITESDVLGIEAPLWTETVRTLADIDSLVFPRLAAVAEIAWSPAAERNLDSFTDRVSKLDSLWDAFGIRPDRAS